MILSDQTLIRFFNYFTGQNMVPGNIVLHQNELFNSNKMLILQNRRTKWKKQNPGMDANSPTIPQSPNGNSCGPGLSSNSGFMSGSYPSAALLYASQLSQPQLSPFLHATNSSLSFPTAAAVLSSAAQHFNHHSLMHHLGHT